MLYKISQPWGGMQRELQAPQILPESHSDLEVKGKIPSLHSSSMIMGIMLLLPPPTQTAILYSLSWE